MQELLDAAGAIEREMCHMAGRLAERVSIEGMLGKEVTGRAVVPGPRSFAETLKQPKIPRITGISKVTTPKVLFVRSADEKQDLEAVKEVIKKSIRPSKMGVNIKRVTKTARGVMIEAEGVEQLEKIKSCDELKDKGLVFDRPRKRDPKIMIYDVEDTDNDIEMIEDIYEQNVKDKIDIDIFKKEFHIVHKYRKRGVSL